jgi:sporulation protein YlmC with PRC-barrel domain
MVSRLTDMSGLDVFTEDGKHVGVLEDVSIDPETGKVLGVVLNKVDEEFLKEMNIEGRRGVIVPFAGIKSIGDIVLMKNVVYSVKEGS